jgi:O-antigen/teichoic acid export membrane protein
LKQRLLSSYKKLQGTNILSNFFNLSSIQVSNILLLFITIRIITGNVGIAAFGLITVAYRFSILISSVVSYGTAQSGVKDTAFNVNDTKKLSAVFYNTLVIKTFIFILFLIGLFSFYWWYKDYYIFILLSIPIVFAEVLNPLCFYIGIEKIKTFNICNLVANVISVLAIIFLIKQPHDAPWVNFILGTSNIITYMGLSVYFALHFKLKFRLPLKSELLKIGRDNFYLTINGLSANLQQSIIIFALKYSNSSLLGGYTLSERFIGQCRNLLNMIGNAVYPNAANVYQQNLDQWNTYRKKLKYLFVGFFFAGAIIIFFAADFIIYTLSKTHDTNAIMILRIMAFVPVISAVNVFSVLDMLLKGNNIALFKIAIILIFVSVCTAFILVGVGKNTMLIATFTIIIEACAWALYEYVIKKSSKQHA